MHRRKLPRFSGQGHDFVSESALAGPVRNEPRIRILPVKLLEWRIEAGLARFRSHAGEHRHSGQRRFLPTLIYAIDGKPHAPRQRLAVTPGAMVAMSLFANAIAFCIAASPV